MERSVTNLLAIHRDDLIKALTRFKLICAASPARLAIGMTGGFAGACSAIEGLSRTLAAELGQQGVRVVCLRTQPHCRCDAGRIRPANAVGGFRRLPREHDLAEEAADFGRVASTAAFLASDHAAAMTLTIAKLTCGTSVD